MLLIGLVVTGLCALPLEQTHSMQWPQPDPFHDLMGDDLAPPNSLNHSFQDDDQSYYSDTSYADLINDEDNFDEQLITIVEPSSVTEDILNYSPEGRESSRESSRKSSRKSSKE